jgi:hypothetical protein
VFAPESDEVGFLVEKVALGQVFSEHFGFPCLSPANLHSTNSSILKITRGRYNGRKVTSVLSGSRLDSTPTMRIKKNEGAKVGEKTS